MKKFFEQCLRDLEAITGIRQLAYWERETDVTEAKRKVDLCVMGMVRACQQYPEIPDEKKMRIIAKMMEEDQKYEALNARTVSKWLEQYRQTAPPKTDPVQVGEIAPPEVADKYAAQLLASLSDFKPVGGISPAEVDKLLAEDLERLEGKIKRNKSQAGKYQTNPEEAVLKELHNEWIRKNFDPITGKPLDSWVSEKEWMQTQKI